MNPQEETCLLAGSAPLVSDRFLKSKQRASVLVWPQLLSLGVSKGPQCSATHGHRQAALPSPRPAGGGPRALSVQTSQAELVGWAGPWRVVGALRPH